jgi:hypothetical protein
VDDALCSETVPWEPRMSIQFRFGSPDKNHNAKVLCGLIARWFLVISE